MKNVLITGGNKGIGLSISKLLCSLNYNVTSVSRTLINQDLINFKQIKLDLSDLNEVSIFSMNYSFDIVINNAGIFYGQPLDKYSTDQLMYINNINLLSPVLITQSQLKNMIKNNFGRIINICSTAGIDGHIDPVYGATKAGLINFGLGVKKSIPKNKNITINSISPGPVLTEMSTNINKENKDWLRKYSKRIGEPIDPKIIAEAVKTLILPETRVTGQNIIITNGIIALSD